MTKNCIFCEIIKEKKILQIYENEHIVCFLDRNPISKGHCLVIPKKHYRNIFDIQPEVLSNVILATKKVSLLMKEKLGAKGVNILHASGKSAQQSVFHFHLHLVPRYSKDGLDTWPKDCKYEGDIEKIFKKLKNK